MNEKIKKYDTIYHRLIDYNKETGVFVGMFVFKEEFDLKEYVKWLAFYIFAMVKIFYDGEKRYTEDMYNEIFELVYMKIRKENVYQNENNEFILEYDVNITELNNLKNIIRNMEEDIVRKGRSLYRSKEEKEAANAVVDMLTMIQFIKNEIQKENNNVYIERLSKMIKK